MLNIKTFEVKKIPMGNGMEFIQSLSKIKTTINELEIKGILTGSKQIHNNYHNRKIYSSANANTNTSANTISSAISFKRQRQLLRHIVNASANTIANSSANSNANSSEVASPAEEERWLRQQRGGQPEVANKVTNQQVCTATSLHTTHKVNTLNLAAYTHLHNSL